LSTTVLSIIVTIYVKAKSSTANVSEIQRLYFTALITAVKSPSRNCAIVKMTDLLEMTNALAYYSTTLITAVKSP
jgi:hypothetical protein